MTLLAYKAKLEKLVPGSHPLDADALDGLRAEAVQCAVSDYSKTRPRLAVADIVGDGGRDYLLAVLDGWTGEFSSIRSVGYPEENEAEYTILLMPTGFTLRLVDPDKAEIGESIRVWYTIPHVVDDTVCTVSAGDESAVQFLAAAYYCEFLASAYAQESDPTVRADSVGTGRGVSKQKRFLTQADTFRKNHDRHFGISDGKVRAASATRSVRKKSGVWDRDRL